MPNGRIVFIGLIPFLDKVENDGALILIFIFQRAIDFFNRLAYFIGRILGNYSCLYISIIGVIDKSLYCRLV